MIVQQMLHLIDTFDLYGRVAYPKTHTADDVAEVYRLATRRRGVFVNPAVTGPFGLTLIEAAASGLPIVATHDGGPTEIIEKCKNGVSVDPMDASSIADGLLEVLQDGTQWSRRSRAGVRGADTHFSWSGHAKRYLRDVKRIRRRRPLTPAAPPARMVLADRLLVCDIDNTLLGDLEAAKEFASWLGDHRERVAFGVATGRDLKGALGVLSRWSIPIPDALITSVGSEIHYWRGYPVEDLSWRRHIDREWDPDGIREALEDVPGLKLQPKRNQSPLKVSYFTESDRWPGSSEIRRRLRDRGLRATAIASHSKYLDLLPAKASKGQAVRHLALRWGFNRGQVLVAGDSGNDALMLKSAEQAVVVGNFSRELRGLRGRRGIHFATAEHARGILEGIRHFGFLDVDNGHQPTHDMTLR